MFFSSSRELTTSLTDTDWLVSTTPSVSTWRNSRLTVLWPFVLGLSRPTVWGFLQNLKVLERMRFVFIALVRSRAVDIGQNKRIFEGTKPTNMI